MSNKTLRLFFISGLLLSAISLLPAWAIDNNVKIIEEYTPKLQIEFVIKKAKEFAIAQGRKIDKYFIESIKYDSDKKEWTISFMGDLPMPGNHFFVTMKDRTGETKLFMGQ
jgi:hypothetical protein